MVGGRRFVAVVLLAAFLPILGCSYNELAGQRFGVLHKSCQHVALVDLLNDPTKFRSKTVCSSGVFDGFDHRFSVLSVSPERVGSEPALQLTVILSEAVLDEIGNSLTLLKNGMSLKFSGSVEYTEGCWNEHGQRLDIGLCDITAGVYLNTDYLAIKNEAGAL